MNDFKSGKLMKAVTFSYDDGVLQDAQMIRLMNKYGIKCTFNLNSDLFGKGGFADYRGGLISHHHIKAEDVSRLYQGHEIAVHTLTHPHLERLPDDEVIRQVEEDRLKLSELAGYEVVGMAYPYGTYDDRVIKLIREHTGVRYSRTVNCNGSFNVQKELLAFDPTCFHQSYEAMTQLAHQFLEMKPNKPQIFYIWGHSYEQDYDSYHWARLEEFFRLISGHQDIFYGTNAQVLL